MEKKTVKRLTGIVLIFSILIVTLLCADMYKVLCNDEPLFSVKKAVYEDGGTVEYIIGYCSTFETDSYNPVKFYFK